MKRITSLLLAALMLLALAGCGSSANGSGSEPKSADLSAFLEDVTSKQEAAMETLPADALNGMKPVLVSLDGTETVLPFEAAGDKITFTLDFAEPEMPVFLIRLVPEA